MPWEERPLPPIRLGRAVLIVVPYLLVTFVVILLAVRIELPLLPLVLLVPAMIVGYHYYQRRRCPQCREVLLLRPEYYPGTSRFRIFFDCAGCGIAWDSGIDGSDQDAS